MLPEPSNLIQVTLPSAEAAFCATGLELHSDDAGTWQIQGTDAAGKLLGSMGNHTVLWNVVHSWEDMGPWTRRAVLWQVTFDGVGGAGRWSTVLKRMPLR